MLRRAIPDDLDIDLARVRASEELDPGCHGSLGRVGRLVQLPVAHLLVDLTQMVQKDLIDAVVFNGL